MINRPLLIFLKYKLPSIIPLINPCFDKYLSNLAYPVLGTYFRLKCVIDGSSSSTNQLTILVFDNASLLYELQQISLIYQLSNTLTNFVSNYQQSKHHQC